MFPISRTTSFPEARASSGVATAGSATTQSGSDRPSPDLPISPARIKVGNRLASLSPSVTTSACLAVALNPLISATVLRSSSPWATAISPAPTNSVAWNTINAPG